MVRQYPRGGPYVSVIGNDPAFCAALRRQQIAVESLPANKGALKRAGGEFVVILDNTELRCTRNRQSVIAPLSEIMEALLSYYCDYGDFTEMMAELIYDTEYIAAYDEVMHIPYRERYPER